MKRFILGLGAVLIGLLGGVAVPLQVGASNTDNFTIRSFDADYYLDKDSEGRSTLKTVEKIVAVFPDYDQNHGLERALPEDYNGHSTALRIQSVTDGTGTKQPYSESISNGNLVLRIGEADTYVRGAREYVITYTQRDVSAFFKDTNDDEFYWDVNGTQWPQAMERVSARVHVAPALVPGLTNKASCYQGMTGSTRQCAISRSTDDAGTLFSTAAVSLGSYENMTVAIGFAPHTFAAYQLTMQEKIMGAVILVWVALLAIGSIVAIAMIIWMSVKRHQVVHRIKGRGTIVPEYLPPKEESVLVSAQVLGNTTADMTAQIIDLAVRHYLKIYQTKDKTLFKPAEYELEIAKEPAELRSEELELLRSLFGKSNVHIGARFAMKKLQNNYTLAQKLVASRKQLQKDVRGKYGLYEYIEREAKQFKKVGVVTIIVGVLTLSPLLIIAAIVAFIYAHTLWPLTKKGVALKEYLAGLREYISVAEEERLKMLQSPEGAEKVGVKVNGRDSQQLIKLYERVLPYAVLFGIEKEWTKQLGAYYEAGATQPDWYSGNAAFNAVVFSSAVSNFSSQSSSYSSSSSSSSGGSGGGGSSGGGGGGGGGGGW